MEKTVRRAKRADIVVANHALVLAQTATGGMDDGQIPTRLIFDEGHHLFDAADSAFSAQLRNGGNVMLASAIAIASRATTAAGTSMGAGDQLSSHVRFGSPVLSARELPTRTAGLTRRVRSGHIATPPYFRPAIDQPRGGRL